MDWIVSSLIAMGVGVVCLICYLHGHSRGYNKGFQQGRDMEFSKGYNRGYSKGFDTATSLNVKREG